MWKPIAPCGATLTAAPNPTENEAAVASAAEARAGMTPEVTPAVEPVSRLVRPDQQEAAEATVVADYRLPQRINKCIKINNLVK